jgi:hypothetical protein
MFCVKHHTIFNLHLHICNHAPHWWENALQLKLELVSFVLLKGIWINTVFSFFVLFGFYYENPSFRDCIPCVTNLRPWFSIDFKSRAFDTRIEYLYFFLSLNCVQSHERVLNISNDKPLCTVKKRLAIFLSPTFGVVAKGNRSPFFLVRLHADSANCMQRRSCQQYTAGRT